MTNTTIKHVFIAGGYGMIGSNIALQIRQRFPESHITLAGRNPARGDELAHRLGNATTVALDLSKTAIPDIAAEAQVIVSAVPDAQNVLGAYAIQHGITFINITSASGDDILPLFNLANVFHAARPVVPLGYYEAGMLLPLVKLLSRQFVRIDSVQMTALHDPADPLGTLSAEELGHTIPPALMRKEGCWLRSDELQEVALFDGERISAIPFTVLDISAVAAMTQAGNVSLSVASGTSVGTRKNGQPSIDLYVDMQGIDTSGKPVTKRVLASDPQGQAHFTALGVLTVIEALQAEEKGGLMLPEAFINMDSALQSMIDAGISITQQ